MNLDSNVGLLGIGVSMMSVGKDIVSDGVDMEGICEVMLSFSLGMVR